MSDTLPPGRACTTPSRMGAKGVPINWEAFDELMASARARESERLRAAADAPARRRRSEALRLVVGAMTRAVGVEEFRGLVKAVEKDLDTRDWRSIRQRLAGIGAEEEPPVDSPRREGGDFL